MSYNVCVNISDTSVFLNTPLVILLNIGLIFILTFIIIEVNTYINDSSIVMKYTF